MKHSILLILLFCISVLSCKEKEEEVKLNTAEKLIGKWKSGKYKWQYFDENGTELGGEDKYLSPNLTYVINPENLQAYCDPCLNDRLRFIFRPYILSHEAGVDFITTFDGFFPMENSESTFRIVSITTSKMVWIIEYSNLEFVSTPSSELKTATKATATLELVRIP
jgi:hypothetical protein